MTCVILNCDKQATYPFLTCSKEHGYTFKKIKEALEEKSKYYRTYGGFTKDFKPEEIEHYSKLIDNKENYGTN